MSKFTIDPRTGLMKINGPERPNANQIFTYVKHNMAREIKRIEMSDTELRDLVTKIMAGTRNIMYLACDFDSRRRIDPIVRAINNYHPM